MKTLLYKTSTILLCIITISACSSLPYRVEMQKEVENFKLPMMPSSKEGVVYVIRPNLLGWLHRFSVYVDTKEKSAFKGYNR